MAGHIVDSDDHTVVGKIGRVTGVIGPGRTGEVMLHVRGGTEAALRGELGLPATPPPALPPG
jgi:hypothetical protein